MRLVRCGKYSEKLALITKNKEILAENYLNMAIVEGGIWDYLCDVKKN